MFPPDEDHFNTVADAIRDGDVVPVLGAGANLCDRDPWDAPWEEGKTLPNGAELAERLARDFSIKEHTHDLMRVSSAAELNRGPDRLFEALRAVFAPASGHAYGPTSLHHFLASLPKLRRDHDLPAKYQLILSTNYDDLLERAFTEANEPFDLVYYLAQGYKRKDRGRFMHVPHEGEPKVIKAPKSYDVTTAERTVILKIHGAVRPGEDGSSDSYVISEEDYVDYLTRTNLSQLFPAPLLAQMLKSHLLFLGYAMSDWNLRVILHRICAERNNRVPAWAIQLAADSLDRRLWKEKGVDVYNLPLRDYVTEVQDRVKLVKS